MINILIYDNNNINGEQICNLIKSTVSKNNCKINIIYDIYNLINYTGNKGEHIDITILINSKIESTKKNVQMFINSDNCLEEANNIYLSLKDQLDLELKYILNMPESERELDIKSINNRRIGVKSNKQIYLLDKYDILYIERIKRETYIACNEGKYAELKCKENKDEKADKFVVRSNIEILSNELDKEIFIRCHNSYIVNLYNIKQYDKKSVTLKNGINIPISRSYVNRVFEQLKKYPYIKYLE